MELKKSIENLINNFNIKEITIKNSVNLEEYFFYLSNSDIGLVTLNEKLKGNNFPLKCLYYFKYCKSVLAFSIVLKIVSLTTLYFGGKSFLNLFDNDHPNHPNFLSSFL